MREKIKLNLTWKRTLYVVFGALLYAIAVEWFFVPAKLYTAGFTGIAMIGSTLLKDVGVSISMGTILILLNIPLWIISWKYIGRTFTFYTVLSVLSLSFFTGLVSPINITDDRLMAAVFGGAIGGFGVLLTLKAGASTGGADVISLYMSFRTERSFGVVSLVINGIIILVAGQLFGWETALYTIINVYVTSIVVDRYNTRYNKVTVSVITTKKDEMLKELHARVYRGITVLEATGSYSKVSKHMLYTVITYFELPALKEIITSVDPNAFVNITDSLEIMGNFSQSHKKMD